MGRGGGAGVEPVLLKEELLEVPHHRRTPEEEVVLVERLSRERVVEVHEFEQVPDTRPWSQSFAATVVTGRPAVRTPPYSPGSQPPSRSSPQVKCGPPDDPSRPSGPNVPCVPTPGSSLVPQVPSHPIVTGSDRPESLGSKGDCTPSPGWTLRRRGMYLLAGSTSTAPHDSQRTRLDPGVLGGSGGVRFRRGPCPSSPLSGVVRHEPEPVPVEVEKSGTQQ